MSTAVSVIEIDGTLQTTVSDQPTCGAACRAVWIQERKREREREREGG